MWCVCRGSVFLAPWLYFWVGDCFCCVGFGWKVAVEFALFFFVVNVSSVGGDMWHVHEVVDNVLALLDGGGCEVSESFGGVGCL